MNPMNINLDWHDVSLKAAQSMGWVVSPSPGVGGVSDSMQRKTFLEQKEHCFNISMNRQLPENN